MQTPNAKRQTLAPAAIRVRRATEADADAVAALAAEVFGGFDFRPAPGSAAAAAASAAGDSAPKLLLALERRRAALIEKDVRERLGAALGQKRAAQRAQRAVTLEARARSLRAALEAARLGLQAEEEARARPSAETRAEARERERRRRDRAFATLIAVGGEEGEEEEEEIGRGGGAVAAAAAAASSDVAAATAPAAAGSGRRTTSARVVGIATLSMRRPEARLPPPFPSSAPLRAYLSDMAVSPRARRSGCARLLLERGCALARRWGEESLWLHVAAGNAPAVALYEGAGFRRASAAAGGGAVAAALAGLAASPSPSGPQVLMVRRL